MDIKPVFDRTDAVEHSGDLHFQALTWNDGDFEKPNQKLKSGQEAQNSYEIFVHGVNSEGNTVCLNITGFTPYFYVEIPDWWEQTQAKQFFNYIKGKLWKHSYGLAGFDVVKRVKLYPYLAGRKFKFIRLIFTTDRAFTTAKWMFTSKNQEERPLRVPGIDTEPRHYTPYESNVNHLNRFYHIRELESSGWIHVKESDLKGGDVKSRAQIYESCHYKKVNPNTEISDIAPLTVLSYDLECLPKNTRAFPNPENPDDIIAQIGVVLAKYGTDERQKLIFNTRPSDPIENITIVECKDEQDLLIKFLELIQIVDHDIITGYNTWGFDDKYLWARISLYKLDIKHLSRILSKEPNLVTKTMTSGAYGNNEWFYLDMPGRETIDLIVSVRREGEKLDNYKLDSVSEFYLNEHKVDLPYDVLFKKLVGGPEDIKLCSEYCVQDSNLVIRLIFKLCLIPNYIEMAKATYVPINWLLFRGQQCKSFSLIVREARLNRYVVPVHESKFGKVKKFKGATVIEPSVGLYYEAVAGLDFASLYPSIMCAYNMCYSTYVETPDMMQYVKENNIPHHTIEWTTEPDPNDEDDLMQKPVHHKHTFVQPYHSIHDENDITLTPELEKMRKERSTEGGVQGILGTILMNLWQGRKATKRLMKNEPDPFRKAVLNGKQLAQKVTMNSMYGFTGVGASGMLPLKAIASSVTATGRTLIDKTAEMAEEKYGATLVYGDSVTGDTPVLVRDNGIPKIINIQDIVDFGSDSEEKQHKIPSGYIECWTETGWTQVQNVMRHKTDKKIIRVLTHTGCVDATEDHSLIKEDVSITTPSDLKVGDKLLQSSHFPKIVKKVNLVEARIWGMFFGDGAASTGKYKSGTKYTFAINNADYSLLEAYQVRFESIGVKTKILDTIKSSGVYKLVAIGDLKGITLKYRELFYDLKTKHKVIPSQILFNHKLEVKRAFLLGLYDADGDKEKQHTTKASTVKTEQERLNSGRIDQKGKLSCAHISYLLRSMGYNVSVNDRQDKEIIFRLTYSRTKLRKHANKIKKIRTISETSEQYVYDLTTENHHFQAGIGDLIVHNTDSCYVIYPIRREDFSSNKDFLEANFKMAIDCAQYITDHYKKPIELEFEKFMWPFYLFTKKRYAYKCWEQTDQDCGLSFMGLQVKRRDTCKDVKKRLMRWFEIILDENLDLQMAIDRVTPVAKQDIQEFMKGTTVNYKELIISSQLKASYKVRKNGTSIEKPWTHPDIDKPHVRLAQIMKKTDPVNHPRPPERVPYLFIEKRGAQKQCDKVIHPGNYDPEKHKLDTLYYFDHQFLKPIDMFFEHLMTNPEKLYKRERITKINESNGQHEIMSSGFFKVAKKPNKTVIKQVESESESESESEDINEDLFDDSQIAVNERMIDGYNNKTGVMLLTKEQQRKLFENS